MSVLRRATSFARRCKPPEQFRQERLHALARHRGDREDFTVGLAQALDVLLGFRQVDLVGDEDLGTRAPRIAVAHGPGAGGIDLFAGGGGATPFRDGNDTGGIYCNPTSCISDVEFTEIYWPFLFLSRYLAKDSGGYGKFRGGRNLEMIEQT